MRMIRPEGGAPAGEPSVGPLPNRFTRATALGCLGIAGVLALPALLLLPLEDWHVPRWLTQSAGLGALAAMAAGIWLLARVPAERPTSTADERHPLTRAGRAPVIEQPAGTANRAALLAVWGLGLVAAGGYVAASVATRARDGGASIAVTGAAGLLCAALGILVVAGRMPVPAWTWVRTPIQRGVRPQGAAVALFGGAVLAWALLAAAGLGYGWGVLGLAALVLGSVLVTPLSRRWPRDQQSGDGPREGHQGQAPPSRPGHFPAD
jgi:hypothetical protein